VASQRFGKSKSTIEKYLQIYDELIAPKWLEALHAVEHPILERVEELSALAKRQDDIPALVAILCQDREKTVGTFGSLHDAQQQLQRRKDAARCRQNSRMDTAATEHTDASAPGVLTNHAPARSAEGMPRPERHTSPPAQALAAAATALDLQDLLAHLAAMIDQSLTERHVFTRCDVRIRKQSNTRGRHRLLITIQE